jgi:hypothetical protein
MVECSDLHSDDREFDSLRGYLTLFFLDGACAKGDRRAVKGREVV